MDISESSTAADANDEMNPLDFDSADDALTAPQKAALTQGVSHLVGLLAAIILFAVADSWALLTDMGISSAFAMVAALFSGIAVAQLAHEWGHYIGARYSGAVAPLKSSPALLAYEYDFKVNTPEQFLSMSYGGSLGNVAAIILVWLLIPLDAPHRQFLLASTIGTGAFVAMVEWPVIKHVREHKDPMAGLIHSFGGGLPVFAKAIGVGFAVALVAYWMM